MMSLVGALFVILLVIGISFSLSLPGSHTWPVLLWVITSALYLGAGMIARRRRPHNRIGLLMLLTGLSLWFAALVDAPVHFLSMVGAATASLPLALTLHLLLAFPSGRVRGRFARFLVLGGYVASTVLQAPLLLLGDGPMAFLGSKDGTPLATVAMWLQAGVGVSSVLGAAVLVAVHAVRSDPIERRHIGPMVWYRVLFPVMIAGTAISVDVTDAPWVAASAEYVQLVAILGLPLVFLVGLLFGSFGRSGEVDEMIARIADTTPTAADLTAAVALALGDPEAVVVYARGGAEGFVDDAGHEVLLRPGGGRQLYEVQHNGEAIGAIVHRNGLIDDHAAMDVLAGIVAMGIGERRLMAQQRALICELRTRESELYRSRRRLLQAEDLERRRIARDLHDGAQQHIVFLGLMARRLSRSATDPQVAASAADIADGMTGLLAEFRDLIAGIMPAPLLDRGLVPAVQLLAEQMPIPTTVTTHLPFDELPTDAESTLYFTVSEALTNVVKHAAATSAQVAINRIGDDCDHRLVVCVVDDGIGGADPARGSGLTGLIDRIATLGGTVQIDSSAHCGSTIRVEIPCA